MTAQQLKNSILQMAVQGKLVPQDPNDEPASVLLERIKAEKQELIKAGKIKKDKKTSEIFRGASRNLPYAFCEQIGKEIQDISDEIPFEIPDSWEWVRLGGISYSIWAGRDKPDDFTKVADDKRKIPVVANGVTNDGILGYTSTATANADTITIAGRGTIGFSVYRTYEYCPIVRLIVIEQAKQIDPKYLQFYLMYMPETSVGSSIPQLTVPMIQPKLIPFPPIQEQHRIVAKIEELLPYIEKYAHAETQLTALNTSFPEALKKSILQEAIQGRLVPQDPNDEPASVLLERIRAEKQVLVKAGKIKKEKPLPPISPDEIPFEIPQNWLWVRLESVCRSIMDGDHQPPPQTTDGMPFIVISNLSNGSLDFSNTRHVSQEYFDSLSKERIAEQGDILFTVTGSFGIPIKVDTSQQFCFQRHIALLKPISQICNDYLLHVLKSEFLYKQCDTVALGVAQRTVGIKSLRNFPSHSRPSPSRNA